MGGAGPAALAPMLPSGFVKENENAVDRGACGVAAFATGTMAHFFYCRNAEVLLPYSSDLKPYGVTSLRFHGSARQLAFGDNHASVVM